MGNEELHYVEIDEQQAEFFDGMKWVMGDIILFSEDEIEPGEYALVRRD